jgi:hypothetical protein
MPRWNFLVITIKPTKFLCVANGSRINQYMFTIMKNNIEICLIFFLKELVSFVD